MEQVATAKTPAGVRLEGLKLLAGNAGVLLLARLYIWAQLAFWPGHLQLPGVLFILPPVVAAFGLTGLITGNDKSLLRLPLVVLLAIVGIGLTFALLIPRGYQLVPH